jgi:glycosyltransferase involved in cell wall biosynthesis
MPKNELRVALLGFTVPDSSLKALLADDVGMPVQTHKFAWNLVRSLEAAGCAVRLLSSAPASTFPRNRRILFTGGKFHSRGTEGRYLGFINLLLLKHVTRIISCLLHGNRALKKWDTRILLVHGVHSPFLWFGVLAKWMTRITVVPILTDPPGVVLPSDGMVSRVLKKIDIGVVKSALRRCDGVVALTPALAADFAPNRPSLTMEGFFDESQLSEAARSDKVGEEFHIVYAGGLTSEYGVDRLVEAVRAMEFPEVTLSLFGRGELEPWVAEQSQQDSRIRCAKFVEPAVLGRELARADVVVNPRPIDQGFVKYSFPSKLMEYFASSVPVVTTRLPGIPLDYERHLIFTGSDSVEDLRSAITQVKQMEPEVAMALGRSAMTFAKETRSTARQGAKLREFLSTVQTSDVASP